MTRLMLNVMKCVAIHKFLLKYWLCCQNHSANKMNRSEKFKTKRRNICTRKRLKYARPLEAGIWGGLGCPTFSVSFRGK